MLRPEEVLTLSDNYLIAFQRGMPPILARRIKWYQDPDFNPAAAFRRAAPAWRLLLAAAAASSRGPCSAAENVFVSQPPVKGADQ